MHRRSSLQSEKLANGLTVWLVQQKNLPKAAVTLTLRGQDLHPARSADARGISDLLCERDQGESSTLNARQIAERSQAAGGDLTAEASTEHLTLSIEPLSEHLSTPSRCSLIWRFTPRFQRTKSRWPRRICCPTFNRKKLNRGFWRSVRSVESTMAIIPTEWSRQLRLWLSGPPLSPCANFMHRPFSRTTLFWS